MASPWTNDKEEEFVAMIEGKPELFDNTEMNFTNKTAKMNAWLELAKHFQISGERERLTAHTHALSARFTPPSLTTWRRVGGGSDVTVWDPYRDQSSHDTL